MKEEEEGVWYADGPVFEFGPDETVPGPAVEVLDVDPVSKTVIVGAVDER